MILTRDDIESLREPWQLDEHVVRVHPTPGGRWCGRVIHVWTGGTNDEGNGVRWSAQEYRGYFATEERARLYAGAVAAARYRDDNARANRA